ncbi:MAG: thermonuclease family protein [Anaerolineae bacterium]|nr:thermonuclease family protein [Anaerolineae bacterium]
MKRKSVLSVFLLLVVSLACNVSVDISASPQPGQPIAPTIQIDMPTLPPVVGSNPNEAYATVVDVVDGDTIKVNLNGQVYSVRYIGMDTPEMTFGKNEPFAHEAYEFNKSLVQGRQVLLVRDVSETDRYGRLLRYVYADGIFVNAELVRQGLASAATFPPDVAHQAEFTALMKEARENKRGMWADS